MPYNESIIEIIIMENPLVQRFVECFPDECDGSDYILMCNVEGKRHILCRKNDITCFAFELRKVDLPEPKFKSIINEIFTNLIKINVPMYVESSFTDYDDYCKGTDRTFRSGIISKRLEESDYVAINFDDTSVLIKYIDLCLNNDLVVQQGNKIFYISDAQPDYYKPKFPFSSGSGGNFMTRAYVEKLMSDGKLKPTDMIQSICILYRSVLEDTHIYYKYGRDDCARVTDSKMMFSLGDPVLISDFLKQPMKNCVVFEYTKEPYLCRIAVIEKLLPLKYVRNPSHEFIMMALKTDYRQLRYLNADQVDDEVREFVKSSVPRYYKEVLLSRREFFVGPKVAGESTHEKAVELIQTFLVVEEAELFDFDESSDSDDSLFDGTDDVVKKCDQKELFNDLDTIKHDFLSWMCNGYKNLPLPKYALGSIGYADECHKRNRHFVTHLNEISQRRINITKSLYFDINDRDSAYKMINENLGAFKFLIEMGFDVVFHCRKFWRRGTDVKVKKLKINEDGYKKNLWGEKFNVFIVNPNVEDGHEDELCASESEDD